MRHAYEYKIVLNTRQTRGHMTMQKLNILSLIKLQDKFYLKYRMSKISK